MRSAVRRRLDDGEPDNRPRHARIAREAVQAVVYRLCLEQRGVSPTASEDGLAEDEPGEAAAAPGVDLSRECSRLAVAVHDRPLPPEAVGWAYEESLAAAPAGGRRSTNRKTQGIYYTPGPVVGDLVRRTVDADTARILDPACGCGAFLLGAFRELVGAGIDPAAAIEERLFGSDIDDEALGIATRAMTLAFIDAGGDPSAPSRPNLTNADAFDPRRRPFDDGPFDVLLCNPPFGSFSGRQRVPELSSDPARPASAGRGWPTLHGRFVDVVLDCFAPRRLGLVLPAQVGQAAGYRSLRRRIAEKSARIEVRYWGEDVFPGAVTPALTIVADRESTAPACIVDGIVASRSGAKHHAAPWVVRSHNDLLKRLHTTCGSLGSLVADVGVHTGNCAARLVFRADDAEGECAPVLEGRHIGRHRCASPARVLRLDYQPQKDEYFTIRPVERYRAATFVIRQTASHPIVGPRRHADYFRNSLLALYPPANGVDVRYLVGLLNSKVLRFLYGAMVAESRQRAFPQVKVRALRALPIVWPDLSCDEDRANHDEVVDLVQHLLAAHASADHNAEPVAALDAAIDEIVCDLYDLSAPERAAALDLADH